MNGELSRANYSSLPLGVPSFDAIRERNRIYVDKTDLIVQMIGLADYLFLARPRRFGKTILVSTIAALFREGAGAFAGLKAEKLWHEKTYPVIQLDFSCAKNCSSEEDFRRVFDELLYERIRAAGYSAEPDIRMDPVTRWRRFLEDRGSAECVLLIDEYDAPLTAHLHDKALFDKIRVIIGSFFDATKSFSGKLRFLFVTGIMKFRQASLFSTFNNITDISLVSDFGSLLGITEDELREYFAPYISRAGEVLNLSFEEVVSRLRTEYDGFCFDEEASTHVFAPWSVLSFLTLPKRGFEHYWFDSAGTPAILVNYLKNHSLLDPADFDADVELPLTELSNAEHIDELDERVLLVHAGYLTIKQVSNNVALLTYPNKEVRDGMAQLYSTAFWPDYSSRKSMAGSFLKAIEERSAEKLLETLNLIVRRLDYQNFLLTSEAAVRQLVQIFCFGAGIDNQIERHSAFGRSDLEFSFNNADVVIEFKFAKCAKDAANLIEKAKAQIIEKKYGFSRSDRELIQIALVFSGDERSFSAAEFLP